jgi:hypothetical protein
MLAYKTNGQRRNRQLDRALLRGLASPARLDALMQIDAELSATGIAFMSSSRAWSSTRPTLAAQRRPSGGCEQRNQSAELQSGAS